MALVRATALVVLARFDEAEEALVEARALVFSTGNINTEAEVLYVTALLGWVRNSPTDTLASIDALLALDVQAAPVATVFAHSYPFTLSYWRGRAYELRSVAGTSAPRSIDQARFSALAFEEFDRGAVVDRYAEASMLFNAAVLVREFDLPTFAVAIAERAEAFAWCEPVRFFEFLVFQTLGARRAFEGDHLSALRYLRRAADCAPSVALRLQAVVDRCRLIQNLGETVSAAEELDYALRLSAQVDWNAATPQERATLSGLAQVLAPSDPVRARAAFKKYIARVAPASGTQIDGTAFNRIKFAEDRYAEGLVFRGEGESRRAIASLIEAYETWSDLGYDRLRGMAACELAELTGEPKFVEIVRSIVARYPSTPLARRLREYAISQTVFAAT